jgi:hypothetical protein
VTSRATTLGKVGSFIGGMAGSIASGDPENFVGGWSGAPAGKSIARQVVKRATEGAATECRWQESPQSRARLPTRQAHGPAHDDWRHGRSVAENAAAGALFGTAHAIVPHVLGAVRPGRRWQGARYRRRAHARRVRDPIVAASIRAGTVKDRSCSTSSSVCIRPIR